VTVLKGGRKSAVVPRGAFDERSLARAMTGRDLEELPERTDHPEQGVRPLFRVSELAVDAGERLNAVHGVSFEILPGEILGVAGVEGNGQRELVDAIAGVTAIEAGSIELDGRELAGASPRAVHAAGLSVIPEDRQGWGLVLDMTLAENLALAAVVDGQFRNRGLLSRKSMRKAARRLLEEYDVRPPDPDLRALSLSGGNQQKVVLARELARGPRVLVAANPTQGLDVGAAEYVHRRLLDAREGGSAILLVSHDLDELLKLSDRIIVLYRGKVAYEGPVGSVSIDDVAMAMAGTR
jgi:ABC-type uncharacterized transport system ATPase subunit